MPLFGLGRAALEKKAQVSRKPFCGVTVVPRRGILAVAPWKVASIIVSLLFGAAVLVATGLGELLGSVDPFGSRVALAAPPSNNANSQPSPTTGKIVAAGEFDVDGGTVPLAPQVLGAVVDIPVQEGDEVKAGQPLLKLDARIAELLEKQAQAATSETAAQLARARQAVEIHKHKIEELKQTVIVANSRLSAQRRQVEKLEKLRSTNSVPEENFLAAKDQLTELEASLRVAKEEVEQLEHVDPNLEVQQAQAADNASRAKLDAARENLAKHTLLAPTDGRILRLQVGLGQILGSVDPRPPIWFCPAKPAIVRCEVEQEFADRIEPGMVAEITNETLDNHKWTGRLQRIAAWVAPRRSVWNKAHEIGEVPTIECIVDLDPDQGPIRIGQRVRVTLSPSSRAQVASGKASARE